MSRHPIGYRDFTDGSRREILEDDLGQFVVGDDGNRVDGLWLPYDDPVEIPIDTVDERPLRRD